MDENIEYILKREAEDCLMHIRMSPGKVYEYELRKYIHEYDRVTSSKVKVVDAINSIFGLKFLCSDSIEAPAFGKGLDVIYTNPELRLIIDLLLSERKGYDLDNTIYADSFDYEEKGSKCYVTFSYREAEENLSLLKKKYSDSTKIEIASDIFYKKWNQPVEYDLLTNNDIIKMLDEANKSKALNLKNKCIKDFDFSKLLASGKNVEALCRLNAVKSLWIGNNVDFSGAKFLGGASFKGALIKADKFIFSDTIICLNKEYEGLASGVPNNELSFRNTRFLVNEMYFDNLLAQGDEDNKVISFEDSNIDATYISLSKMKIDNTKLYFYQTLMKRAKIRMVEPNIVDSELEMEDSEVDSVVMLNIDGIPNADFRFRFCKKLIINNCVICGTVRMDNLGMLSLKSCENNGKIVTEWDKRSKGRQKRKKEHKIPLLQAVLNNEDSAVEKAQQFILLKENFAALGQYEHEDEAFILYMDTRKANCFVKGIFKLLRLIGNYGISPIKVILSLLVLFLGFSVFFFASSLINPSAFSFSAGSGLTNCFLKAMYLSVSNLVSYNTGEKAFETYAIVACLVESIIGWFMLGYLSVSVLRKTLR